MNLIQPLFSVLPRSRASAMLLAASVIMATVATTLVAAVPMYSDAIIEAGLRSTLLDAPPASSGLEATFRANASSWVATSSRLDALGSGRLPGDLGMVTAAQTDTYSFPDDLADEGRITSIGTFVTDPPLLVPTGSAVAVSGPGVLAAGLHVDAADLLGLGVGDRIELERRGAAVVLEINALLEPADRFDELWFDQPLFRDGLTTNGSFTEVGPFIVDPADFSTLTGTANYRWRVIPDPATITTDDLDALRVGAAGMERAIGDRIEAGNIEVTTDLPALIATTDTAIGATAAVIAAILIQLVGVALYGVGLSASVLVSSRAVETSMLRSRGATAEQLAAMAAVEAALIATPAVALGPVLGGSVVELVERWGPVATTGLDLRATITTSAVVASVVIGVLVVGIVTWPAFRSARGFARSQAARARPEGPLALQRTGLDVGLAALAVLGLWRLSRSSASTSDLAGRLGTDPVLVLAPTLGVIAASLLTLRLIAGVAAIAQRYTSAQGALSMALAGWELARRPGRTARTSVLIVLSVTVGAFAAVHGASWQQSLRDQADAGVSADAIVEPDATPTALLPAPYAADAYRQLDGVTDVVPVDRPVASVSANLGRVPVVATDARALATTLRLRDDLYGAGRGPDDLARLHQPAEIGAAQLGEVTGDLTLRYELAAEPSEASGDIRLAAIVLDGNGTPVRIAADPIPLDRAAGEITFPLTTSSVPGLELALAGPLRLVDLEVSVPSVQDVPFTDAPKDSAVFELDLRDASVGERPVSIAAPWRIRSTTLGQQLVAPSVDFDTPADALWLRLESGVSTQARADFVVRLATDDFGAGDGAAVPVVVTPAFLAETELEVGDVVAARLTGTAVVLRIDGVVPVVPFAVRSPIAMLVDWETLAVDRWRRTERFETVDAWALSADAETARQIERTLSGDPYASVSYVERRQEARDIAREPVTVGLSGSLGLALSASLVIAAVGLVLTAVVGGRERRPAFAVLRAMGTRASELRRWLLLETVPLVGLSAVAGLAAGIALARLALPSLAVSRDGSRSVPAPVLVVPWGVLAVVVAIAVAAGMALPVVTARLLRRHRTADELRIGDTT